MIEIPWSKKKSIVFLPINRKRSIIDFWSESLVQLRYHCFVINLRLRCLDANKITSFVSPLFVIRPSSFSQFSSFIICECVPELFIYYFFVFHLNDSFVLFVHLNYFVSFCWMLHSLYWMEAFIWSSSQMNGPSLINWQKPSPLIDLWWEMIVGGSAPPSPISGVTNWWKRPLSLFNGITNPWTPP